MIYLLCFIGFCVIMWIVSEFAHDHGEPGISQKEAEVQEMMKKFNKKYYND